jgi:hypothetical protein
MTLTGHLPILPLDAPTELLPLLPVGTLCGCSLISKAALFAAAGSGDRRILATRFFRSFEPPSSTKWSTSQRLGLSLIYIRYAFIILPLCEP